MDLPIIVPAGQPELRLCPRDQDWSRSSFLRRSCSGALPESMVRLEDEAVGGPLEDVPGDQGSDGALRMRVRDIEPLCDPPSGNGARHPENQ